MGSFSWRKADKLTKIDNIAYGKPFKFLIPKEFGGGFIKDIYQDYGQLGKKADGTPKYDMYELLAFWNKEYSDKLCKQFSTDDYLKWDGRFTYMPEISKYTDDNRSIGIKIGCYDNQIDNLKYPLKLVSCSYKGTYEDCDRPSYGDPDQGFFERTREKSIDLHPIIGTAVVIPFYFKNIDTDEIDFVLAVNEITANWEIERIHKDWKNIKLVEKGE